jgi:sulfate transport system ATP-binding protein
MSIVLDQLTKRYGTQLVVSQVSLEIERGEFFVLLGASGSGKSTILRMIAGLTPIDGGRVLLHDRDVSVLRPQDRNVGFVFQNYALFRHMTVAENIEFALTVRRTSAGMKRKRREELLEIVGLSGMGGRLPSQLSGGQQQRVALARALAHEPSVLLLDEPFGALDAPIRAELRRSLLAVHRELGVTTIFVTHDQEEAFELGDRIGVMRAGRLLEVGPPTELYFVPRTEYVATFLGSSNLLVGTCDARGVALGPVRFPLGTASLEEIGDRRVQVLFRPEDVAVRDSPESLGQPLLGHGVVMETKFAGSTERLRLKLPRLPGVRPIAPAVPFGDDCIMLDASRPQDQATRFPLKPGDEAWVGVRRVHALPNPGLVMLLVAEARPEARYAFELGGAIALAAHARVAALAEDRAGSWVREGVEALRDRARTQLSSFDQRSASGPLSEEIIGETERRHYDLVIHGRPSPEARAVLERELVVGDHHVLVVPGPCVPPQRILICVAVGEPGKEDVRFAGRLARHLGAETTIACVLPEGAPREAVDQANRFLAAGQKTLSLLDVKATTRVRRGAPREQILQELTEGAHDLLVLGSPLPNRRGVLSLDGLVGDLLDAVVDRPVLIIRSQRH